MTREHPEFARLRAAAKFVLASLDLYERVGDGATAQVDHDLRQLALACLDARVALAKGGACS